MLETIATSIPFVGGRHVGYGFQGSQASCLWIGTMSQSTLDPAGQGAADIVVLFYWMCGGAIVIWTIVVGLAIYAVYQPGKHNPRHTKLLVIGGGALFPTLVLTGLLCASLPLLAELQRPAPAGGMTVHVSGVMWWWRVAYETENGEMITTANEIRLPVNRPAEFKLRSEDVIHSFWIPALGGKVDMIPGRTTRLKLHPTRVGRFRGVCAEFCGAAHAQMNFDVVVMPIDEFDLWLNEQSNPHRSGSRQQFRASQPRAVFPEEHFPEEYFPEEHFTEKDFTGEQLFQQHGCGACHQVRGTVADGDVGPDLTHFGSRSSIAAGVLPNTTQNLVRWIQHTHQVKPGVQMPAFRSLSQAEAERIALYLGELE